MKLANIHDNPEPLSLSSFVLGERLVAAGYSIREDDHFVYLDFENKQCGRFTHFVSIEIIRMVANDFMTSFAR